MFTSWFDSRLVRNNKRVSRKLTARHIQLSSWCWWLLWVVYEGVVSDVFHRLFPPPFIRLGPHNAALYRLPYRDLQSQHQLEQPKSLKVPLSQMTRIRGLPTVMKRLLSILGYLGVAPYPATSIGMHFAIGWTPAIIASSSVCCADTIASQSTILFGFPHLPHWSCARRVLCWHISTQHLRPPCEALHLNLYPHLNDSEGTKLLIYMANLSLPIVFIHLETL